MGKSKIIQAGIYQYSFTNKKKKYIGSSCNLYKRHSCHMSLLNKGKHYLTKFQKDFDEEGIENLKYEVLEFIKIPYIDNNINTIELNKILIHTEQKYFDSYHAQEYLNNSKDCRFFKLLYNKAPIAGAGADVSKYREVHQFTLDGTYIQSFLNSEVAARCTNVDGASIKKNCYNQRKSAGGYIWSFEKVNVEKYKNSTHKRIYQYSKNKELIKSYSNIASARKETGIDIRKGNSNDRMKTQGGYYWLFNTETFPVFKRTKGEDITITYKTETKTLSEWGTILNISNQNLLYRIKNWGVEQAIEIPKFKHPKKTNAGPISKEYKRLIQLAKDTLL